MPQLGAIVPFATARTAGRMQAVWPETRPALHAMGVKPLQRALPDDTPLATMARDTIFAELKPRLEHPLLTVAATLTAEHVYAHRRTFEAIPRLIFADAVPIDQALTLLKAAATMFDKHLRLLTGPSLPKDIISLLPAYGEVITTPRANAPTPPTRKEIAGFVKKGETLIGAVKGRVELAWGKVVHAIVTAMGSKRVDHWLEGDDETGYEGEHQTFPTSLFSMRPYADTYFFAVTVTIPSSATSKAKQLVTRIFPIKSTPIKLTPAPKEVRLLKWHPEEEEHEDSWYAMCISNRLLRQTQAVSRKLCQTKQNKD